MKNGKVESTLELLKIYQLTNCSHCPFIEKCTELPEKLIHFENMEKITNNFIKMLSQLQMNDVIQKENNILSTFLEVNNVQEFLILKEDINILKELSQHLDTDLNKQIKEKMEGKLSYVE